MEVPYQGPNSSATGPRDAWIAAGRDGALQRMVVSGISYWVIHRCLPHPADHRNFHLGLARRMTSAPACRPVKIAKAMVISKTLSESLQVGICSNWTTKTSDEAGRRLP